MRDANTYRAQAAVGRACASPKSGRRLHATAVVCLGAVLAGCDGYVSVNGKVSDPLGNPIEGANVRLVRGPERARLSSTRTVEQGQYWIGSSFAPTRNPRISLVVEAHGFRRHTEALDGTFLRYDHHNVVLDPRLEGIPPKGSAEKIRAPSRGAVDIAVSWCPGGEFVMGSPPTERGRRGDEGQTEVALKGGFWIAQTEVTQLQWKQVMGTTPWRGSADAKDSDNYPATWVDHGDAANFCSELTARERRANRLGPDWEYSLPTEAQWEYAARAGQPTAFSFGDDETTLAEYAWYRKNTMDVGEPFAHRVARKKPNPWGLYDIHGNAREWCRDRYLDPAGGSTNCVVRGGSWYDDASLCRSACRMRAEADFRWGALGFRVVRVKVPQPIEPRKPGDHPNKKQGDKP